MLGPESCPPVSSGNGLVLSLVLILVGIPDPVERSEQSLGGLRICKRRDPLHRAVKSLLQLFLVQGTDRHPVLPEDVDCVDAFPRTGADEGLALLAIGQAHLLDRFAISDRFEHFDALLEALSLPGCHTGWVGSWFR